MWPNRQINYQIPQEEGTLNSPPPMPAHQLSTVYREEEPEPENEEFNRSASLDMALVLLSVTHTYTPSQTTENTPLRCDCIEMMSMQEQEFVITNNLVPRRPFSHLASDVPYYSSLLDTRTHIGNSAEDAGPSQQNEYIEEETRHPDISPPPQPSQDLSGLLNAVSTSDTRCHTTISVHTDVSPPPERLLDSPVPNTLRVRCLASMPQPSSAAMQVANRVINYARAIRNAREEDVSCLNCGYYPVCPITGQCGHTRCAKCIQDTGKCPCGNDPPESLYVNVLIQDLIRKAVSETSTRTVALACSNLAMGEQPSAPVGPAFMINEHVERVSETRRGHGAIRRTRAAARAHAATPYSSCNRRVPISLQARYNHALKLLAAKRYLEAAPHLALAAGSRRRGTRPAHTLLAQVITTLCKDQDPRRFNRQLNRSVRQLLSTSWVKLADMECILCSETFRNPVTTPCGHTFCRICIERTLDYGKRCPLCLRSLQAFNLNETRETVFVQAALASIHALHVPAPLEPDLIPIFVCTVAYPSVPCPLFIFDPRYWMMIRRVLESGSRKFGMLYGDRDCRYANIGTILEVRDCVHFEDGRSILSTVGVSRFRVIERSVRDGCEVARIRHINDVSPIHYRDILDLRMMGNEIVFKAVTWLIQINPKMLDDIETTFGGLPRDDLAENWWETADGPAWLWWLVAVLPLRSQIKVLILATDCLLKRMMAVLRTLDTLVPEPAAAQPQ